MTARLVLGGVSSGVGKTTATVGLARALRARGLRVALFKCGPDYLDPTYHRRAAGAVSHNLDGWLMGREAVLDTFTRAGAGADVALVEGVMGLFDGVSPTDEAGSTAEIARWLGAPTALVVDVGGMARSLAALVAGFHQALPLCAVIANRVGSRGHLEILRQAQKDPPVLGAFPVDEAHAFPERHLGLRTADEQAVPEALFAAWGDTAGAWWELDALLARARQAAPLREPTPLSSRPPVCRIGLADDPAFHFYYEDNLRRLEGLGAELVRFSPLTDSGLPTVDGLYLGGGYPEVHARTLAANVSMRAAVRAFPGPIYAECGGLMYLSEGIRTLDGELHPMVGLVPGQAVMSPRLEALGYVEVETQSSTCLGGPGLRFRGHQFRYSRFTTLPTAPAYRVRKRRGGETFAEGHGSGRVLGSYVHAHWASNPQVAAGFVGSCCR